MMTLISPRAAIVAQQLSQEMFGSDEMAMFRQPVSHPRLRTILRSCPESRRSYRLFRARVRACFENHGLARMAILPRLKGLAEATARRTPDDGLEPTTIASMAMDELLGEFWEAWFAQDELRGFWKAETVQERKRRKPPRREA